jgi:hypothetical protein
MTTRLLNSLTGSVLNLGWLSNKTPFTQYRVPLRQHPPPIDEQLEIGGDVADWCMKTPILGLLSPASQHVFPRMMGV